MGHNQSSGDLGRRLYQRRRELGATREEVASRAGMDPGYLQYLEEASTAGVDTERLLRLADALETSAHELLGGGVDQPPGHGRPGAEPTLESLEQTESMRLLEPGGVGRVVFDTDRGPMAIPVNFKLLAGDVVFRTAEGTAVAAASETGPIGFEADRIDDVEREGWSVLASGRAHRVVDPDELRRVRELEVEPWAGGGRDVFFRIVPNTVSGRRIRVRR